MVEENGRKFLKFKTCNIHKNNRIDKYSYNKDFFIKNDIIEISYPVNAMGSLESVNNYSTGSQVFKSKNQWNQFIRLCESHLKINSNFFTYTICDKRDFDNFN